MAVTGDGTQEHPYEVHSYDELKTACNHSGVWIELANDIDCNDYGENFEWQTVSLGNSSDLDLKTHMIKNFKVADNNYAFHLNNWSKIHNGKILNAYLARSYGFSAKWNSTESRTAYFDNLSISANTGAGVVSSDVFRDLTLNACAIYIEGDITSQNTNDCSYFMPYSADYPITNCDIYINNPNGNKQGYIFRYSSASAQVVKNCRIRGNYHVQEGAVFAGLAGYCSTRNCVWDITSNCTVSHVGGGTGTGIINTDNLPSGFNTNGVTVVDSTEIISGALLRAKNFDVINVVGS